MYDPWTDFSAEPGRHHETYEGARCLLPELSIVGWLRFFKAFDHALQPDSHQGEYEIHYVVNGELHWWVENNTYEIHSGTILVIKPGELHGSNTGVLEPSEIYWLRIGFPKKNALPGLTIAQTQNLKNTFETIKQRTFPASLAIRRAFMQIIEEHRLPADYSPLISRSALHVLLSFITRDYMRAASAKKPPPPKISPYIQRSLRILHSNISHPPSISELAKNSNMSETAFRKRFKDEVGCSPLAYITRRRIQEAKKLLAQGEHNITDVAYNLGFSSSQYFATVYKRITGQSPSQDSNS